VQNNPDFRPEGGSLSPFSSDRRHGISTGAMIHPTASVHPAAQIDSTVDVAAHAVIDADVVLGPGCVVGPFVHLTGRTTVGEGNRFHAGCVIGDAPQDLRYDGAPTRLRIASGNIFREHVTVHRSNRPEEDTVVGSNNYFMANSHVGHNSIIGDHVIMANGATLGGHVVVENRAFISGNCLVHQFTRVGRLSLMQGGTGISKDLAPFTIAQYRNRICGLNVVGLRRAGMTADQRLELRKLYHAVFRSKLPIRQAAELAATQFDSEFARELLGFIARSRRGVCAELRRRGTESGKDETTDETFAGSAA
jgi:UDP-N-acetylglucosamine acyltransferase